MPVIHLLKEGLKKNGQHLTKSIDVSIEEIERHFKDVAKDFSTNPPTVRDDIEASEWAEYQYMVVEIQEGEELEAFPKAGYYLLKDVSPSEYRDAFSERIPKL